MTETDTSIVNIRNCDGNVPLHFISRSFLNQKILSTMMKKGVDINARNKYEETPLHYR